MTTPTATLTDRVKAASPDAHAAIGQALTVLVQAAAMCQREDNCGDILAAVTDFLERLGVPDVPGPGANRSDNPRPLYQRIDEENQVIVGAIQRSLNRLTDIEGYLAFVDFELADAFHDDARAHLWDGFGLPTREEVVANPEQYPDVDQSNRPSSAA